jgi:hypothetical protein
MAALLAVAALFAACGGGGAGGEGDPATAVPADALFYAEVVVRPEGSLRDGARDAAGKVLLTEDPEGELREQLEVAFEVEDFDYDRDVEPWLGERAGFWMRSDESAVLLLAATDTEEARASLERSVERGAERSYRDTEYVVDDGGLAVGIVGDFAAAGPEAGYKRTIDAFEGDSLAEADEYADAVDALEDERLAHFWADMAGLLEQSSTDELPALVPLDRIPPIAGSFSADGSRLSAEVRMRGGDLEPLLAGGSTPLLQELPGDSWFAMGAADAGEAVRDTVERLAGAIGGLALRREVRRELGLDLERDLLDWIGHAAVFVRGSPPEGGVVIQPSDEDRAADAFGRIVGAIQLHARVRAQPVSVTGADQAFEFAGRPLVLARGARLVVLATTRAAAEAALGSDDRLGETDLYEEAQELVGMEPGALLSMPEVIEHVDDEAAKPYLEVFTVIAAATTVDGDDAIGRFAAGLE